MVNPCKSHIIFYYILMLSFHSSLPLFVNDQVTELKTFCEEYGLDTAGDGTSMDVVMSSARDDGRL